MHSATPTPARPLHGAIRRLLVPLLIATVAAATFGVAAADRQPVLAAEAVTAGYRDHQYGDPAAPGGDDVSAARNQSKLWFHDGHWFAVMFDTRTQANAKFRIWRFDMATQSWTNTGVAVDDRNRSHADVLAVGRVAPSSPIAACREASDGSSVIAKQTP